MPMSVKGFCSVSSRILIAMKEGTIKAIIITTLSRDLNLEQPVLLTAVLLLLPAITLPSTATTARRLHRHDHAAVAAPQHHHRVPGRMMMRYCLLSCCSRYGAI